MSEILSLKFQPDGSFELSISIWLLIVITILSVALFVALVDIADNVISLFRKQPPSKQYSPPPSRPPP